MSVFWDLLRTFVGIKQAKHTSKTNHDAENFFLPRIGWRTLSVGQLYMSKANNHIGSAHECVLWPSEDLCGHQTGKTSLENQSWHREPSTSLGLFSCRSNLHVKGTQTYWKCPRVSFETSWAPLWASNWQNILGKAIMPQRIFSCQGLDGKLFLLVKFTCPKHRIIL